MGFECLTIFYKQKVGSQTAKVGVVKEFLSIALKLDISISLVSFRSLDPIDVRNLIMLIIIWVKISTVIFMLTK